MTLVEVHAFVAVALAGSLLAPPGSGSGVGVVWHDQATVPHETRQRLLDAIALQSGLPREAIVDDAVREARMNVAHEVAADRVAQARALESALGEASTQYRTGALDAAAQTLQEIQSTLRADPVIPGAAAFLWRVHVLRAQIAGTRGDEAGVRDALLAAIALDPEARPSTRRVPPAIVSRHAELAREMSADRSAWARIDVQVEGGGPVQVEIDGRPAAGPVAPGPHLVVVRRPGHAPVGREVSGGASLHVDADEPPQVPDALPTSHASAERICDVTGLERLVLARARSGRVGLQAYVCGVGFTAPWFSDGRRDPTDGVVAVLAAAGRRGGEARVFGARAWPVTQPELDRDPGDRDGPVAAKPWYKRWWVWTIIGGAVVAGVTTGAVLGTRQPEPSILVPVDEFK